MMTQQQLEFASRIARIEAGTGTTKATVFVGIDESFQYLRAGQFGQKMNNDDSSGQTVYLISMLAALFLGVASYVMWLLFVFHFRGSVETTASLDSVLITDSTASVVLALVLGHFLRLRAIGHAVVSAIGVAAGLCALHNFVRLVPHIFETLFSPVWVSQLLQNTVEFSLIWRGVSYTF